MKGGESKGEQEGNERQREEHLVCVCLHSQ